MDKIIQNPIYFQVLVQNIAVADLGYALVVIFPTIIASAANGWVLGNFLCEACALLQFVFGIANVIMVCALSVCKLSCLLVPMRARIQTKTTGYVFVGIMWLVALVYPSQLFLLGRDLPYNPYLYRCMAGNRAGTIWVQLELINTGIFIFIPLVTLLVATLWLLAFVHKVADLNKQGLFVVLSVSFVFFLSYCPLFSYNVAHIFSKPSVVFYKLGIFIIFISSASNPFLYLITSRNFKDFVTNRIFAFETTASRSSLGVQ